MALECGPSHAKGLRRGYDSGDGHMVDKFLGGRIQGHISLSERGVRVS